MLLAATLALAPALPPQGARPERVARRGPTVAVLLERAEDSSRPSLERMAALEDLVGLDRRLPLARVRALRGAVRAAWLPDYLRCLTLCGPDAVAELRRDLGHRDPAVRAEAVFGVVSLDAAGGEALAREVLADRREEPEPRIAALRGLIERGSPFARTEGLRRMNRAEGPFLLECFDALRADPHLEDAPYLVELLHQREGRAASEAIGLLEELTGYRLGPDPRAWRYWMLRHRADGTPFRAPPRAEEDNAAATVSYHGIPVRGSRVVFVLDSSGSMESPLPETPSVTRGQRAVEELVGLLPRLPRDARFGVVFFRTDTRRLSSELVPCDGQELGRAVAWLEDHRFGGGTNLYEGLERAFEVEEVEEVFLLSDGEPSAGALQDPDRIAAQVRRWNRWRKVRIHTISFGAPPPARDFLHRLAAENGGVCRVIW
jgi:hypothetical protein